MTKDRLARFRDLLDRAGVEGFVQPRADEHLGEYVPAAAERLAWLTGFTGSAGIAVILEREAAVFTDGRYVLQLAEQTDPAHFACLHLVEQPPQLWAASRAKRLGYDPWLMSEDGVERYVAAGLEMVPLSPNPIDRVWLDRPARPVGEIIAHPLEFSGESAADKRAALAAELREAGQNCCVLTDPASVNWLLNLRGSDLPFTPVLLAFAIAHATGQVDLFVAASRVTEPMAAWLGPQVVCHAPETLEAALEALIGQVVRVDRAGAPAAVAQLLRRAGATVVAGRDPCVLPKARKNAVEQAGARAAHRRDGIAVCRFLQWLERVEDATEISAAAHLLAFRRALPLFRGESFPAISAAGEHGAIIHYRVTPETDRPIRRNEVFLIDSGAQFADGTTDITRTVWTGPDTPPDALRAQVTRVMKGHIALATTIFPHGVAGSHLDALARRPLWGAGLDYDHGTGHGVGSVLSVHEGPCSLSRAAPPVPIEAGMILSNEPGFYAPGAYGIRLENLLLVEPAELPEAIKPFLRFATLTLVPFDRRLLNVSLLDSSERAWLDAYHTRVFAELGTEAESPLREWLEERCAPLSVV